MLGITLYPGGISYADVADLAKRAEQAGFGGIYFVEQRGNNDALAAAQVAASTTTRLTVGTNIVNAYLRHPSHLAAQAMAVDEISAGRLVLGIGASHRRRVEELGMTWQSAPTHLTEATRTLRAAFAGEGFDGRPLNRSANNPIPVHWAGVVMATIAAAGREADGLMMFLATVQHIAAGRAEFENGARESGQDATHKPVSLLTPICLSEDLAAAYASARRFLSFYAAMPVYQKVFAESGFEAEVAAIRGENGADLAAIADHLSEALLDAIVLIGPPARCREQLAAFTEAGIDDPLLSPQVVDGTAPDAAAALIDAFAS